MKTCPQCSHSIADVIGQCPFCRHVWPAEGGKPMVDAELIAAAMAAERAEARIGGGALFRTFLLLLALPVLVPTLLWFWIGARRWGRVDWLLLAVTGGVLTLFALGSPYSLAAMLVADAAAAMLFVLRYAKLDEGIFLGYSNVVALPLIFAGLLGAWGVFVQLPVGPLVQLARLHGPVRAAKAADLTGRGAPATPCPVRLENTAVAAAGRIAVLVAGGKKQLVRATATRLVEVAAPKELWERREQLAGAIVELAVPPAAGAFVRTRVTIRKSAGGSLETDPHTRHHALLPGTGDRVWIAGHPVGPGGEGHARELETPGPRTGLLVISYGDAELAKAWSAKHGSRPLPDMAVTVMPGVAPGPESDPSRPAYLPVEGTGEELWAYLPYGTIGDGLRRVVGILEDSGERVELLRAALPGGGPVRVISAMPVDEFVKASGLIDRISGQGLGSGLALLCVAGGLALIGLIASLRE